MQDVVKVLDLPCVVRRTFSALFGRPSQDGVCVSGSISTHWTNSSRLHVRILILIRMMNNSLSEENVYTAEFQHRDTG